MRTEDALAVAVELVSEAGTFAAARQSDVVEQHKEGQSSLAASVVTEVDVAVERFIDRELGTRCPTDALVGEEYAQRAGTSGRTWQVDPVDGTLNFARALGPWSVVLSAWQGDEAELVAVWTAGRCWTARRGGGAWLDGQPLRLDGDHVETGGLVHVHARMGPVVADAGWLARTVESSAAQMCQVADGRATGTVRLRGERRDLHGPALLVEEAGGTVTDLAGGRWSGASTGLVAAGAGAHADLLRLVA